MSENNNESHRRHFNKDEATTNKVIEAALQRRRAPGILTPIDSLYSSSSNNSDEEDIYSRPGAIKIPGPSSNTSTEDDGTIQYSMGGGGYGEDEGDEGDEDVMELTATYEVVNLQHVADETINNVISKRTSATADETGADEKENCCCSIVMMDEQNSEGEGREESLSPWRKTGLVMVLEALFGIAVVVVLVMMVGNKNSTSIDPSSSLSQGEQGSSASFPSSALPATSLTTLRPSSPSPTIISEEMDSSLPTTWVPSVAPTAAEPLLSTSTPTSTSTEFLRTSVPTTNVPESSITEAPIALKPTIAPPAHPTKSPSFFGFRPAY